eukprot:605700-Amorphochlora_amoeboformis.AAC.1
MPLKVIGARGRLWPRRDGKVRRAAENARGAGLGFLFWLFVRADLETDAVKGLFLGRLRFEEKEWGEGRRWDDWGFDGCRSVRNRREAGLELGFLAFAKSLG